VERVLLCSPLVLAAETVFVGSPPLLTEVVFMEFSLLMMIDQRCVLLDWNVRGLNGATRWKVVRDLAQDTRASTVCLQETKMQQIDQGIVVESLGQRFDEQFVYLPAVGTRGGALLAVDESCYKIVQFDVRKYSVSAQLQSTMGVGTWWLTWLTVAYGPQDDQAKLRFLQELRMIRNSIPKNGWSLGISI
jgi:exonuclease III